MLFRTPSAVTRAIVFISLVFCHYGAADTKMKEVVAEHKLQQCGSQLQSLADDFIGENEHRLHLDMPKRNADKYPLTVVGVISYRDREAQFQCAASPMADGMCEVACAETFVLEENCIKVRQQMFKEWEYIGRLSGDSFFLRHKERLTRNATLTNHGGDQCLVSRRHSGI